MKAFSLQTGKKVFRYLFVTYTQPDPASNGVETTFVGRRQRETVMFSRSIPLTTSRA